MGLLLIARFTLHEAIRRRLFLAVLLLSILMLIGFALLFHYMVNHSHIPYGIDPHLYNIALGAFVTVPIMWFVYLLSSLLTIIMCAGIISSEVEAGTFVITVPKPLHRFEIVAGKWLCYALLSCAYTALLFFGFTSIIYWLTGFWSDGVFNALGLLELGVLVLLSILTFSSTLVPTAVSGVIALVLFISAQAMNLIAYLMHFLAPDKEGSIQSISTIINLIMPTDALWHGASYYLTPTALLNILDQINLNSPLTATQSIPGALIVWAIGYCLLLPLGAIWFFQRRDL